MEERYYFSTCDILVKTNYDTASNSIQYASHRALSKTERRLTERYVLQRLEKSTQYYERSPALLIYTGVEESLQKELGFYHLQGTIQTVLDRKEMIEQAVQELVHDSLASYYFDRLGDELLKLRQQLNGSSDPFEMDQILENIQVLLSAYNENSGQNLSLNQILPKEILYKAIRL
jgi:hypothetical protein